MAKRLQYFAYCFASGHIKVGKRIPDGALPLYLRGSRYKVRSFVEAVARHGYQTELVKGRPTKIPGTEHLLVPGVPEAPDDIAKVDALTAFCAWIKPQAIKRGISSTARRR